MGDDVAGPQPPKNAGRVSPFREVDHHRDIDRLGCLERKRQSLVPICAGHPLAESNLDAQK